MSKPTMVNRDELAQWLFESANGTTDQLADIEARATLLPDIQKAFMRGATEAYRSVLRKLDQMTAHEDGTS